MTKEELFKLLAEQYKTISQTCLRLAEACAPPEFSAPRKAATSTFTTPKLTSDQQRVIDSMKAGRVPQLVIDQTIAGFTNEAKSPLVDVNQISLMDGDNEPDPPKKVTVNPSDPECLHLAHKIVNQQKLCAFCNWPL